MKKLYLFVLASIMMLFSACHDRIWDAIDDLDARVAKLEELCKEMNTNISSLQTIVSVLQENDYITGITPIEKGDKVIGYTITFGKHDPITIYNGVDGKDGINGTNGQNGIDGYTPILGIAKDTDGVYYWTLDGEWLLDADGNKLRVTGRDGKDGQDGQNGKDGVDGADGKDGQDGADGKDGVDGEDGKDGQNGTNGVDGKDGVTPQLKIENNYWYISYDNGATWTELGKAVGEDGKDGQDGKPGADGQSGKDGVDGDSMFSNVTYDENNVYFTLTNGIILVVPRGNNSTSDFDQTVIDNLVNSLELDRDTIVLNIGDKDTIIATTAPFSNSKVTWTSSDITIVKVDNGIVEATSTGKAIVSVKAGTLMKECYIFVSKSLGVNNEYVDLGLSVKWATFNVGATSPEEYGDYFAWGEVEPKTIYDWSTYKYGTAGNQLTKYCDDSYCGKDGFVDNKRVLNPEDDVATMNWGSSWRIPTKAEQDELCNNCTWIWAIENGVNGYKVVGPSGNSIFLPSTGFMYNIELRDVGSRGLYWVNFSFTGGPYFSYVMCFDSSSIEIAYGSRSYGVSVRPVCE